MNPKEEYNVRRVERDLARSIGDEGEIPENYFEVLGIPDNIKRSENGKPINELVVNRRRCI
jgi:hypothetical protein